MVRAEASGLAYLLPLLPLIVGCFDVELVEVRDHRARSAIYIELIENDQLKLRADISIDAGADEDGRPRRFDDPRVHLMDHAVAPIRQPRPGFYEYQHDTTFLPPSSVPLQIALILPTFAEPGTDSFSVWVPAMRRDGPISITIDRGRDLTLVVARPTPPDSIVGQWTVDLSPSCDQRSGSYASLGAQGWPPDSIRIPSTLLGILPTSTLEACLRYVMVFSRSSKFYLATTSISGVHTWHVEIGGAASGNRAGR